MKNTNQNIRYHPHKMYTDKYIRCHPKKNTNKYTSYPPPKKNTHNILTVSPKEAYQELNASSHPHHKTRSDFNENLPRLHWCLDYWGASSSSPAVMQKQKDRSLPLVHAASSIYVAFDEGTTQTTFWGSFRGPNITQQHIN